MLPPLHTYTTVNPHYNAATPTYQMVWTELGLYFTPHDSRCRFTGHITSQRAGRSLGYGHPVLIHGRSRGCSVGANMRKHLIAEPTHFIHYT